MNSKNGGVIIKQLFNKSVYIIIYFASVAIVATLGFSTLVSKSRTNNADFLSEDFIIVRIEHITESNSEILYMNTIQNFFKSNKCKNFIVIKDYPLRNGRTIFFKGTIPRIKLTEGRIFNVDDFKSGTDTVIVREEADEDFLFGSKELNIIGRFSKDYSWNYMANMFSQRLLKEEISGEYIIDANGYTMQLYDQLCEYLENTGKNIRIEGIKGNMKSKEFLFEQKFIIIIVFLTIALLLLNTFSATSNWLNIRKREMFCRKLVGGKARDIKIVILKDYLILVTTGFIIGFILSQIIINIGVLRYIANRIEFTGLIYAYVLCIIMGLIIGVVHIHKKFKKEINKLMR